jgi:hypothetical protein
MNKQEEQAFKHNMENASMSKPSEVVRQHAIENYIAPARRRRERTVSVNAGAVHKALRLGNRVPLVCTALESQKFLREDALRLISKIGPPSGQSTTVTYTYEFIDEGQDNKTLDRQDAWNRLRGALKDVLAELGGGKNYLRSERANFYGPGKDR